MYRNMTVYVNMQRNEHSLNKPKYTLEILVDGVSMGTIEVPRCEDFSTETFSRQKEIVLKKGLHAICFSWKVLEIEYDSGSDKGRWKESTSNRYDTQILVEEQDVEFTWNACYFCSDDSGWQLKVEEEDLYFFLHKGKVSIDVDRAIDLETFYRKAGPCYVATCVYGSYDCPEVWTLRRYRDDTLASTWYGRAFVRLYYAVSPTLVRWFGKTKWFQRLFKGRLDRMVKSLREKGVEDTPYRDKEWK